jgi:predicted ArsR family transcriptional regulator
LTQQRRRHRVRTPIASRSIRAAAALDGELSWRIYAFIRERRQAVTRRDVAEAVGISRTLAAFHHEKLLTRGLLRAHYARPAGRGGPGAGRPAKYYEPSDEEIQVSIPQRRYDVVGRLFIAAIHDQAQGEGVRDAALRVARERGVEAGSEMGSRAGLQRPDPERTLRAVEQALEPYGFEPYRAAPDRVALGNCPFRVLATEAPELVCDMNRSFLEGVIRGLGNETVQAVLESRPADCCVSVRSPDP